jgi:prepilin-type N-terminal cleavage/methylation domain-containing protein
LQNARQNGFTLIELSIVLVIIGLIVGGVLVGQDLIRAAEVRAQLSQIQRYSTAVYTFLGKYGALPGDMPAQTASSLGFAARGSGGADGYAGAGDGNGLIEGLLDTNVPSSNCGYCVPAGEPIAFWNDLTYANGMNVNLIEGSFNASGLINAMGDPGSTVSGASMGQWLPPAKLGRGNYVYVWSQNGLNYFGISKATALIYWDLTSLPQIPVNQAYALDKKADDGLPQSGTVLAMYVSDGQAWAGPAGTAATPASPTTCYDNANTGGATQQYSVKQNNGSGVNCVLSFQFQ